METRNLITNDFALQKAEEAMLVSSWSYSLIRYGTCPITNTMNASARMAWYWSVTMILGAAIP
jgi:hypothetical protein